MRVGVIGTGSMGTHHARVYKAMKEAELIGVFDTDFAKAKTVAQIYDTKAFPKLSDLLNEVEAVNICVPTNLHKDIALEAIYKKIHVLVEKPIATTLKEAREITEAAAKNGVILMAGHIERFNPVVKMLKEVITPKEVVYMETQRLGPYPTYNPQEGVVLDLMIHDIDIILYLIEDEVKKIHRLALQVKSVQEDIAHVELTFESGVVAILTASRISQRRVRELTVTQRNAHIAADFMSQEVLIRTGLSTEYVVGQKVRYKQAGTIEVPYIQKGEPLERELENFIGSIQTGEKPLVTGQDGQKSLRVALDILAAS